MFAAIEYPWCSLTAILFTFLKEALTTW
jgi:hypothetical protein